MKILITGGGTTERIDDMRVITNESTGRTAITLANFFSEKHEVTLLLSEKVTLKSSAQSRESFFSVDDLYEKLKNLSQRKFNMIIHAAAIGDYTVSSVETQEKYLGSKIPSGLRDLTLKLKPTKKIIDEIKKLYGNIFLVGFKLTADLDESEVERKIMKLFEHSNSNLVVQNKINERRSGVDRFNVYKKELTFMSLDSIEGLGKYLENQYNIVSEEL